MLLAGGDPALLNAIREAVRVVGIEAAIAVAGEREPPARVDLAVIAPNWCAEPLHACLRFVREWIAVAPPVLIADGTVILVGPPAVSMPGPGYADFVKARLVLGHMARALAEDPNPVRAVTVWREDPAQIADAVAEAMIGQLASCSRLRSAGATFRA